MTCPPCTVISWQKSALMPGERAQGRGGRRLAIGAALVALLLALYVVTFNGYAISGDERFLFDATESLARRGHLRLNFQAHLFPATSLQNVVPPEADTEPLQPLLAVPLFVLAQALPGVGLAHTVWLFNVLVTALTTGVLYWFATGLGYRARVGAVVAILFGIATMAWPYSRTFFREPLFTLLALLSVQLIRVVSRRLSQGRSPLWPALGFILVFAGAIFSKEAALLLVPGLVAAAIPARIGQVRLSRRGRLTIGAIVLMVVIILVVAVNADTLLGVSAGRYAFVHRLQQVRRHLSDAATGLAGYLFSPARSIWLYSPVLLLGIWGAARLIRQRRWREFGLPLSVLVMFVVGYALIRGPQWYGGTGWGARYLLPVIPFLALWLLPVVERLLSPGAAGWQRVGALTVVVLSVGVQMLGVLVPVNAYYEHLAGQTPPVVPWEEGAWSLRWSPLAVHLELLGTIKPDIAWLYAAGSSWLLPLLAGVLAALAVSWLWWWVLRRERRPRMVITTLASLFAAAALVLGLGMYAIRLDPRYWGDFDRTRDLLAAMDDRLDADDVVVLSDFTYTDFFMNYYKRRAPVVYTLPQSPGEQPSPEQPAAVTSPDPDRLIHPSNPLFLSYLARHHDRLWLVLNSSPFVEWAVRPVEWWLSRHYFPLEELAASDTARAVSFLMTSAPPATAPAWPDLRSDATFAGELTLLGFDLPSGASVRPGEGLPVSLVWRAERPMTRDYTVGVLLVGEDGVLAAQHDSGPVNGFSPTSGWQPGDMIRDNHGLMIPGQLAPGRYELWVVVYWWQEPGVRLPVSGPVGVAAGDHALLTTITVE